LEFNSIYTVRLCNVTFDLKSGPQDDHFVDLEHDSLVSWEDSTLRIWAELSSKGGICVDVGAYLGVFAIVASLSGAKKVIALEPNPLAFAATMENVMLNGLEDSIEVLQLAASNKFGESSLLTMPYRPLSSGAHIELTAHSSIVYNSKFRRYASIKRSDVKLITLDSILMEERDKVSVLKIDVEGYELLVLEGASNTIESNRPKLIIEIVNERQRQLIDRRMSSFGYLPGVLIKDKLESRNYLYRHTEDCLN
jgi:FkbM family methyltransferase